MTAQELKNSILMRAVSGKLVPQDPNDEPASVLLAKIRDEKEQMMKDGKIKKAPISEIYVDPSDNQHYEKVGNTVKCIEDEIPFEIPKGWAWCRLSYITSMIHYGYTASAQQSGNSKLLRITDIQNNQVLWDNVPFCSISKNDLLHYELHNRDIVIARTGGTIGKTYIIKDIAVKSVFASYLIRVIPLSDVAEGYIKLFMESPEYWRQLKEKTTGTGQPNINAKALSKLLIPIPPQNEAFRILDKMNTFNKPLSEYNLYVSEISDMDNGINRILKQSLLQYAIQGKLVSQNPDDEPASVLLERIRAEKEQLIKEGKLKRDKNESYIYRGSDNSYYEKIGGIKKCIDDEIPFEVPRLWEWCRLKTICTKIVDGDHNPPKGLATKTEYLMLSSRNINNNSLVDLENVRYLSKEVFKIENERTEATAGDILLTSVGTLGRSCIFDGSIKICFQRSVSVLATCILNSYLKICLDTPYIQNFIYSNATGTAQKGFYLNQMERLLIPIPPQSYQKKLVSVLSKLLEALG